MANNAKTHMKVSNQELKLILRSYLKRSNNWMAIRNDIRKQVDLLPSVARNLYESGQFTMVKRRMSDQIKKSGNQGYVPKCEQVRFLEIDPTKPKTIHLVCVASLLSTQH